MARWKKVDDVAPTLEEAPREYTPITSSDGLIKVEWHPDKPGDIKVSSVRGSNCRAVLQGEYSPGCTLNLLVVFDGGEGKQYNFNTSSSTIEYKSSFISPNRPVDGSRRGVRGLILPLLAIAILATCVTRLSCNNCGDAGSNDTPTETETGSTENTEADGLALR
ncbi:hypothetical protein HOG48_01780 [Candidatus Peregrinibacteria bacterium]|jgi:hypothetical protein|nr:hypothetical protein [Candidatus Peregrinibacteria bacterium]